MKKILFLLVTVLTFVTCKDDDTNPTSTVNLNFKAVYAGQPLVFQNFDFQYSYPDGKDVFFTTLKFFISDVVLLKEDGSEVLLTDIDYINFSDNSTLEEAQKDITRSFAEIPAGTYKGLRIGIGVPADLNNAEANQFSTGHPLRDNYGEFWAGWQSFIFVKVEGLYDAEGNGISVGTDDSFAHHLGSDPVYRTITINKQIVVTENQPFDLDLVLDLIKLYQRTNDFLDLSDPANQKTHDPGNLTVATYMMDNFESALTTAQ